MASNIKVFIIDDNVMVRYALKQILEQESDIIVVGDASDYPQLHHEIRAAEPNILIFDIPLPRDKGIKRLEHINPERLPAIVFTRADDYIVNDLVPLLAAGAVGFVMKPKEDTDISTVRASLVHELRTHVVLDSNGRKVQRLPLEPLRVVAIGSSTGGPEALARIIPQFPKDFPAGIAIVQHMPEGFTSKFAERLNGLSEITVKEATDGDIIKSGTALLAPGDFHMVFTEDETSGRRLAKVKLTKDPPMWSLRPTVDQMMTSLVPIFGSSIIGVILTGMGEDGVVGMGQIKQSLGRTLVQDEASSVVFGMAQEVVKNNLADEVLPLEKIVPRILEILRVKS